MLNVVPIAIGVREGELALR